MTFVRAALGAVLLACAFAGAGCVGAPTPDGGVDAPARDSGAPDATAADAPADEAVAADATLDAVDVPLDGSGTSDTDARFEASLDDAAAADATPGDSGPTDADDALGDASADASDDATPTLCTTDVECDDGDYCDGVEVCAPGEPYADARGCLPGTSPCTVIGQQCDSVRRRCLSACPAAGSPARCTSTADCDNGVFCDGPEFCINGRCAGTGSPSCPAGTACSERAGACLPSCAADADCDDGVFCNGAERCLQGFCGPGVAIACNPGERCDEAARKCIRPCAANADCDDGVFCNGAEVCRSGVCALGPPACGPFETCNESTDRCVGACRLNSDCDDRNPCNGLEYCLAGQCTSDAPPCSGPGLLCTPVGYTAYQCTVVCTDDSQCDNGFWCDGREICESGRCVANPHPPCGTRSCDESAQTCTPMCETAADCQLWYATTERAVYTNDGVTCVHPLFGAPYCAKLFGPAAVCTGAGEDTFGSHCYLGISSSLPCCSTGTSHCATDADCSDGIFCNGHEICTATVVGGSVDYRGCMPGSPPCSGGALCDENSSRCVSTCVDNDGDGHQAVSCGGDDCDDSDVLRYPGNAEVCDDAGHDEDCDPATVGFRDRDGDGFVDARCCNPPWAPGADAVCGPDCDDSTSSVGPRASEVCNHRDDNCNGTTDEGTTATGYVDSDGDGHGQAGCAHAVCAGDPGWSAVADDCDDTNPSVFPGVQVCDHAANPTGVLICGSDGAWLAETCPAGTRCVAQPSQVGTCL